MTIEINKRKIGPEFPPYIVAELSANHNGSFDRAIESIDAAHKCGVDAVKLQTYTADTLTIDCDKEDFLIKGGLWDGYKLYELYKWAHTPYEWHEKIFEYAKKKDITVFSTPFDKTAVDLLENLNTPAYKIASFEIIDLDLIKIVASTGKPMIISTGMASEEEIEEAVTTARENGCNELILLHCISSYPTPIAQANVSKVKMLADRFNVISGLSDHTLGSVASIAAAATGASFIEKHFTLSRNDKGPDSDFSMEPNELKALCKDTLNAWKALGKPVFDRTHAEKENRIFRRSIYFVNNLSAGSVITKSDIRSIRPGNGLPPKNFEKIIGKKLKISVEIGTPTDWSLFE